MLELIQSLTSGAKSSLFLPGLLNSLLIVKPGGVCLSLQTAKVQNEGGANEFILVFLIIEQQQQGDCGNAHLRSKYAIFNACFLTLGLVLFINGVSFLSVFISVYGTKRKHEPTWP